MMCAADAVRLALLLRARLLRLCARTRATTPQILEVGKGTIQPGTGMAEFVVKYRAIVYRPFKDETVDGVVSIVNKVGRSSPGHSFRVSFQSNASLTVLGPSS